MSSYTSSATFSPGTTCTQNKTKSLSPNGQSSLPASYSATLASPSEEGTWFPGVPCSVSVANLGCYLAWSNATTYYEEGNYLLSNLSYLAGCPNCTRSPPMMGDGMCSKDGSLSCTTQNVNYRCVATLVPPPPPPPPPASSSVCNALVGSWVGSCSSMTGYNMGAGSPVCASGACQQPYT